MTMADVIAKLIKRGKTAHEKEKIEKEKAAAAEKLRQEEAAAAAAEKLGQEAAAEKLRQEEAAAEKLRQEAAAEKLRQEEAAAAAARRKIQSLLDNVADKHDLMRVLMDIDWNFADLNHIDTLMRNHHISLDDLFALIENNPEKVFVDCAKNLRSNCDLNPLNRRFRVLLDDSTEIDINALCENNRDSQWLVNLLNLFNRVDKFICEEFQNMCGIKPLAHILDYKEKYGLKMSVNNVLNLLWNPDTHAFDHFSKEYTVDELIGQCIDLRHFIKHVSDDTLISMDFNKYYSKCNVSNLISIKHAFEEKKEKFANAFIIGIITHSFKKIPNTEEYADAMHNLFSALKYKLNHDTWHEIYRYSIDRSGLTFDVASYWTLLGDDAMRDAMHALENPQLLKLIFDVKFGVNFMYLKRHDVDLYCRIKNYSSYFRMISISCGCTKDDFDIEKIFKHGYDLDILLNFILDLNITRDDIDPLIILRKLDRPFGDNMSKYDLIKLTCIKCLRLENSDFIRMHQHNFSIGFILLCKCANKFNVL
jgi:hypothetical protein